MFILWGQLPYFKTQRVKSHGFCQHCGAFVKRHSFNARTFFHLYYIPLIPLSARVRHHQTCPKCQHYTTLTLPQFEAAVAELKSRSAEAMVALIEGESTVTFDTSEGPGEPIECLDYLVDVTDWLYDSAEQVFVSDMSEKLSQAGQSLAAKLVQAESLRLQGQRREAIVVLQDLMLKHKQHPLPPRRAALLLDLEKRYTESAAAWEQALSVETKLTLRVWLLSNHADSLVNGKQWTGAVKAYDALFAAAPSVASDKGLQKSYSKAKKKAGIT